MFGSVDKIGLKEDFHIPDRYEVLVVMALGKPKEQVALEECKNPQDIRYRRDSDGVHHVPRRRLNDILLDF